MAFLWYLFIVLNLFFFLIKNRQIIRIIFELIKWRRCRISPSFYLKVLVTKYLVRYFNFIWDIWSVITFTNVNQLTFGIIQIFFIWLITFLSSYLIYYCYLVFNFFLFFLTKYLNIIFLSFLFNMFINFVVIITLIVFSNLFHFKYCFFIAFLSIFFIYLTKTLISFF